jgi:2-polyprenyl-3-methyl-5-hydroxy-6-metoxy-1,4-benzoquinol methylase
MGLFFHRGGVIIITMMPEIIVCPVCSTKVGSQSYLQRYISDWNKKEYKLYHCEGCDLEWWEPLKIEKEFYEEEGDESYTVFHLGIAETLGENHKAFFKYFPLKSGRLLDVGCGDGRFLKRAQEMGFEVWGIDFDRKSIEACREKRGLKNVYAMSLEEFVDFAEKEGLKFDVITFFEVLEHQDKPREFLENVKRLLKPGGFMAGSVPNRRLLRFIKKSLNYSMYNFPPHHFLWFDENTLKRCLNFCGFEVKLIIELQISNLFRRLFENSSRLEYALLGVKGVYLRRNVKKKILSNKNFYNTSNFRKIFFKILKITRNISFLITTFLLMPVITGTNLYFQAQLPSEFITENL